MKVKKFKIENDEFVQVYLNVAVFVSGEDDTIKTIKEMLNYEKNALMDWIIGEKKIKYQ